ncbi:hypothetical protein DFH11DRAFT_1539495 [Phellopilus nigrolimitatus]|nr:hypothetical protein DFH11DRAFT_1539495 [Phellopilus nigrolimitatus]
MFNETALASLESSINWPGGAMARSLPARAHKDALPQCRSAGRKIFWHPASLSSDGLSGITSRPAVQSVFSVLSTECDDTNCLRKYFVFVSLTLWLFSEACAGTIYCRSSHGPTDHSIRAELLSVGNFSHLLNDIQPCPTQNYEIEYLPWDGGSGRRKQKDTSITRNIIIGTGSSWIYEAAYYCYRDLLCFPVQRVRFESGGPEAGEILLSAFSILLWGVADHLCSRAQITYLHIPELFNPGQTEICIHKQTQLLYHRVVAGCAVVRVVLQCFAFGQTSPVPGDRPFHSALRNICGSISVVPDRRRRVDRLIKKQAAKSLEEMQLLLATTTMAQEDAIIRPYAHEADNKLVRFMVAKARMEPLAVANFKDWHQRPVFEKQSVEVLTRPDIVKIEEYYTRSPSSGVWIYELGKKFVGLIAVDASTDALSNQPLSSRLGVKEESKKVKGQARHTKEQSSTASIRHFYITEPYRAASAQNDLVAYAVTRVFDASSTVERIRATSSPLAAYAGRALRDEGFVVVERGPKVGLFGWTTLTYELTRERWAARKDK